MDKESWSWTELIAFIWFVENQGEAVLLVVAWDRTEFRNIQKQKGSYFALGTNSMKKLRGKML